MPADTNTILITPQQMQQSFAAVLEKAGFTNERAAACAAIFTNNSVDGIYTHGVNRFPVFVQYVKDGHVQPQAIPTLQHKFGGIEQWDGNLGPGILNAIHATDTATSLPNKTALAA